MAMSTPVPGGQDSDAPMADINTTPLVDVMLVLLIIFLITVPVSIQTVKLALPVVANLPTTTKPENANISVRANGSDCETYWNTTKVKDYAELRKFAADKLRKDVDRMTAAGAKIELPEVHIRGQADMPFKCIGAVQFAMQQAGYQKVGFISNPPLGVAQ